MNNEMESFLKRKNVIISFKRYGIDAMGSMALGLFASLLIGTIINTIGQNVCPGSFVSEKLLEIGGYATSVTGAAMALAIGYALQAPPLVMYSLCAVGAACNALGASGGPLAVFFVAVITCEIGKLVSKETKIDIIVTPAVTVIVGVVLAMLLAPVCKNICDALGSFIGWATDLRPFWMGMIISVVVGIVLTLPISSAAICAAVGISEVSDSLTSVVSEETGKVSVAMRGQIYHNVDADFLRDKLKYMQNRTHEATRLELLKRRLLNAKKDTKKADE